MKAVLQRVLSSKIHEQKNTGEKELIASIEQGLTVLVGVEKSDTFSDADYLAKKISNIRIFSDKEGKLNLSVQEIKAEILLVSQFTLIAETKNGNRPSFKNAALHSHAKNLYEYLINLFKIAHINCKSGKFGTNMLVEIKNDGPVTILLDSKNKTI